MQRASRARAVKRNDEEPPRAAQELVDVDRVAARAFSLAEELPRLLSAWHSHTRHQLLYAAQGVLHLETAAAQWLLPPQRLAWIAGETRHRVRVRDHASLRTVYLDAALLDGALPAGGCCVFAATPLLREMVLYAMRWGPGTRAGDVEAERFFAVLGTLCRTEALADRSFRLPAARSPELGRAMRYALQHLGARPELVDAARAAGLSPRTLARRFAGEAQTTWGRFLHSARMMKAMELLAVPRSQVTETALAVGFDSLSAFSHAFQQFTGEVPKDYRRRTAARGLQTGQ